MGNLCCAREHSIQFFVQFFLYTVKLHSLIMKVANNRQLYILIYYSQSALHVSGDVFAHHQEHLTVFTVSGRVHPSRYWLVSCMS
jgi:hypothetical protein